MNSRTDIASPMTLAICSATARPARSSSPASVLGRLGHRRPSDARRHPAGAQQRERAAEPRRGLGGERGSLLSWARTSRAVRAITSARSAARPSQNSESAARLGSEANRSTCGADDRTGDRRTVAPRSPTTQTSLRTDRRTPLAVAPPWRAVPCRRASPSPRPGRRRGCSRTITSPGSNDVPSRRQDRRGGQRRLSVNRCSCNDSPIVARRRRPGARSAAAPRPVRLPGGLATPIAATLRTPHDAGHADRRRWPATRAGRAGRRRRRRNRTSTGSSPSSARSHSRPSRITRSAPSTRW